MIKNRFFCVISGLLLLAFAFMVGRKIDLNQQKIAAEEHDREERLSRDYASYEQLLSVCLAESRVLVLSDPGLMHDVSFGNDKVRAFVGHDDWAMTFIMEQRQWLNSPAKNELLWANALTSIARPPELDPVNNPLVTEVLLEANRLRFSKSSNAHKILTDLARGDYGNAIMQRHIIQSELEDYNQWRHVNSLTGSFPSQDLSADGLVGQNASSQIWLKTISPLPDPSFKGLHDSN